MTPLVSVLIPTRGRVAALQRTLASFWERALDPTRVEMIVRAHEEDEETRAWALGRDKRVRVVIGDTEKGYGSTDHYINCLAAVSNGDWLWPCADDHSVQTTHWDEVLAKRLREPRRAHALLTAKVVNWPDGRIPIVSRGFYRLLGHMGHTGFADCYLDSLAHFAGITEVSGLEVRDEGLPPTGDRATMENWAVYRGDENCWCFEQDKQKVGAVLKRKMAAWTPREAPERP